ncbi:growth hormone secretagogue receptor type 1-like [Lineus longissimus]|uniref:growth hormone secretagogue receptor type 1-like n=1 Tax=Lineus longissimus TaxID=88925 RepID=UPI00315D4558
MESLSTQYFENESKLPTTTNQEHIVYRDSIFNYPLFNAAEWLFGVVPPFLIVSGTLFNILNIIVLSTGRFGNVSTRILLTVLALTDTVVLYAALMRSWIDTVWWIDLRMLTHASCPILTFISYCSYHFSSWNLVLVTLERFVSVCFPFRARKICTKKWTIVALITLACLISLVNCHFLVFQKIEDNIACTPPRGTYFIFITKYFYWADLAMRSGLPFVVIILCNICIIYTVSRSLSRRNPASAGESATNQGSKLNSMTSMLLVVSFTFITLTLPVMAFFLYISSAPNSTYSDIARNYFLYAVTHLLYYLNSTVNFILYCLSGSKFRAAVLNLFGVQNCFKHGG